MKNFGLYLVFVVISVKKLKNKNMTKTVDKSKYSISEEFQKGLNKIEEYGTMVENYYNEENRLKNLWEEDYPGVPFDSIKIEIGKNYIGKTNGEYEIRTINDELWAIQPLKGEVFVNKNPIRIKEIK